LGSWIAIILVFGTGSILTYGMASRVDNLFATSYGRTLLVKIVAAVLMVLNGAYLGLVLGGRMAAFTPPAGASGPGQGGPPPGPPPGLLRLQKRMSSFGSIQIALALAVLVLNGLL
jgi:putative copper export protein